MWRFMWRGGKSFMEKFDEVSPTLSVEVLCVVFGSVMIAAQVIYYVIYRESWVGMWLSSC